MNILQVSATDLGGGAAGVAWQLFRAYRRLGENSHLAVGRKLGDDPDVRALSEGVRPSVPARLLGSLATRLEAGGGDATRLSRAARGLAAPAHWVRQRLGLEDFGFPGSRRLLRLFPGPPDVIHCHNLHAQFGRVHGYFDLRALASLSVRAPVFLTLHDAWLLTGHCAHTFACERWRTGCGHCPDLSIYPAVRRDATAANWRRKRAIYRRSRLHVATPSRWLMERVRQSALQPAVCDARVIPNGVDLEVFAPGNRHEARRELGLPPDTAVLLFAATDARNNVFKDYDTLIHAVALLGAEPIGRNLTLVVLGDTSSPGQLGAARVTSFPFTSDPAAVSRYYRAADVYVHAARVDTFPTAVIEALACGVPVVATAVGGIPEQVRPLDALDDVACGRVERRHPADDATGLLVAEGDARAMAAAVRLVLEDPCLRDRLGENAARDARQRFDLGRQVSDYLAWYQEVLEARQSRSGL